MSTYAGVEGLGDVKTSKSQALSLRARYLLREMGCKL